MQEFGNGANVNHEVDGRGVVVEVVLYPDGDVHYYVVEFENGRTLECNQYELERVG